MLDRFAGRALLGELMDDPALDPARHAHALDGLARINAWSRTAGRLGRAIRRRARADPGRPTRVLDLACGRGDVTRGLARYANRHNLEWQVEGCDLSDRSIDWAQAMETRDPVGARFFQADALAVPLDGYDAVVSSLFLHHLTDEDARRLLARCREARHVLFSDLRRGPVAWALTWLGCRLLSRSPVVHVDGPRSVRAAFTAKELDQLAEAAGLAGARVRSVIPLRMLLAWSAP